MASSPPASDTDRNIADEDRLGEDDVASGTDDEYLSDEEPQKDAIEQELEKLVFGDATGFKDEIKGFKQALAYGEDSNELEANGGEELAEIDDADVSGGATPSENAPC